MAQSSIEWTEMTWNPTTGCNKLSAGCKFCYAEVMSRARDEASGWDVVERAFIVEMLTGPLYWLGVVELGYAAGEPVGEGQLPQSYRITDVGGWLLGRRPAVMVSVAALAGEVGLLVLHWQGYVFPLADTPEVIVWPGLETSEGALAAANLE